ncbi:acyloxyacyl hydrolase [Tateyamaria sp. SN3-11]|uniref:acyloxyacyl hydrolase n=1 Tax=Tateyamaria sp. SN3-11 TaxID=3092147 RepID=UPI0039E94AAD
MIGVGVDDVLNQTDTQAGAVIFEYHSDPFYEGERSEYSIAVAGQVDGDGDVFVGIGAYALWSLGQGPWFVEASLIPGYYSQGTGGSPLDGNIQIRTLVGVGVRLSDRSRISLAIDHKSNADIEDTNPGNETLSIRYTVSF